MFWKKVVLKNFAKFTGQHRCPSLFFNKVAGLWLLLLNSFHVSFQYRLFKFMAAEFNNNWSWSIISLVIYSVCLYPAGIYMLKFNNRNIRTRCEICSNLTIKTPERRQWRHSGVFVVNFEHISHLVLVFLLLTLSRKIPWVIDFANTYCM